MSKQAEHNKELVLWGHKSTEESWKEDVITTAKPGDNSKLQKAKAWAKTQGYDSFRVQVLDLEELPNFVRCVEFPNLPRGLK